MKNIGKIVHWLPDTDLRNNHAGLAEIAKKKLKLEVDDLQPGEFILFVNTSWTALKVYAANNTILHHKQKDGHRLNPKAALLVPHFISGQSLNYNKALDVVIKKQYFERYKK